MNKENVTPKTEAALLDFAQANQQDQAKIIQSLAQLEGQTAFLRQMVMQLAGNLGDQLNQVKQNELALTQEVQKMSTGGAQRALASVFFKFFRDLLGVMNQLDALVATSEHQATDQAGQAWGKSLATLRNHLEKVFNDWGCEDIAIQIRHDPFDPEIHEAVPALEGEIPAGSPENIIQVVRRRGWRLHGVILQYPQVVVS